MRLSQDKGYASFGGAISQDPYAAALEKAFDDAKALAKEGRKLSLAHVPSHLRTSFKKGYMSV